MDDVAQLLAHWGVVWGAGVVFLAAAVGYGAAIWARPNADSDVYIESMTSRGKALLFVWAVLGLFVFTAIVLALREAGGPLDRFDHALAQGLAASLPSEFLRVLAWFTRIGDRAFLMGVGASVLALLLWHRRWSLAILWIIASAGGGLLNLILKAMFMRVRPDHVHGFLQAGGYSFPSGHATGAVAVYGMLVYVLLRTMPVRHHAAVFSGAFGLIAAVSISRVLLHVHFMSDVIAGLTVTSAWIAACVLIFESEKKLGKG